MVSRGHQKPVTLLAKKLPVLWPGLCLYTLIKSTSALMLRIIQPTSKNKEDKDEDERMKMVMAILMLMSFNTH